MPSGGGNKLREVLLAMPTKKRMPTDASVAVIFAISSPLDSLVSEDQKSACTMDKLLRRPDDLARTKSCSCTLRGDHATT